MKRLLFFILLVFIAFFIFAEEDSQVPRYEGFAAGGGLFAQFPLGDYSDFSMLNLGASLAGEYTLPLELGNDIDLGLAARAEFAHVFPKSGAPLKSDEELRVYGTLWTRVPFMLGNQFFAFQPELGAGLSTFFSKYEVSGSQKSGSYVSPLISAALSLRWIPRSLSKLEVEAAPVFTIVPEKEKAAMMLGLRLGAIWHFQMKNASGVKNKKRAEQERLEREAEEKRREAELAEQKRLEDERQIAEEVEKARLAEEERLRLKEEERLAEEERQRAEAEEARLAKEKEEQERLEREAEEKRREAELAEQKHLEDERQIAEETEKARLAEEERLRLKEEERLVKDEAEPILISERLKLKNILFFSKNGAVFSGLSGAQIRQNERTMDEAVELIKQHPGCMVYIEGYAHNISGTEKENRGSCMPLSLWRAEYVRKELIKRGISKEKIKAVGMGGANSLADPNDRGAWWKDRRVEFVITYESEAKDEQ